MAEFVWEVMTRGVVTVRPDASLVEAAQLMRAQDIGDVLVTADGHMIGVLTDRDITLRAVAAGADPLTVSAQAVCTPNPVVVGADEAVSAAVELMRDHAIRRLPVVEDGHPVGMVSLGDLALSQSPTSTLAHISRARPVPWPESDRTSGGHLGVDTISGSGPGPDPTPWAAPGPAPAAGIGPGTAAMPATGPRKAPTSRGDTGRKPTHETGPEEAPASGSGVSANPVSGSGPRTDSMPRTGPDSDPASGTGPGPVAF